MSSIHAVRKRDKTQRRREPRWLFVLTLSGRSVARGEGRGGDVEGRGGDSHVVPLLLDERVRAANQKRARQKLFILLHSAPVPLSFLRVLSKRRTRGRPRHHSKPLTASS